MIGPRRIAFGTDYPFPLGEVDHGRLIESLGLDQASQERLLSGTALEWLDLEKSFFQ